MKTQQKSKGSETIKVVFRVRPLNSKEKQDCREISTIAHENQGLIEIRNPSAEGGGGEASKTFAFDAVFSEKSSQRHIYDVCAAPVVESVLEGYNGTVFAYGQTGAGQYRREDSQELHPRECSVICLFNVASNNCNSCCTM